MSRPGRTCGGGAHGVRERAVCAYVSAARRRNTGDAARRDVQRQRGSPRIARRDAQPQSALTDMREMPDTLKIIKNEACALLLSINKVVNMKCIILQLLPPLLAVVPRIALLVAAVGATGRSRNNILDERCKDILCHLALHPSCRRRSHRRRS